ncbi:MepB family protein [Imtechella halotolerans]|uniref:MepB family protein n=1 Tax=Imtechella halotolerans K1 TaxID=946077 RepID=I0W906_9FLAO|nr:MepB family protein [Imtechella halotolerans]EID72872.1 hypothetical protein W5A_11024 [Imtechella halotolerans K1]WMQ62336.1 MepB family protein [Imtechella halotolerans]
MNFLLDHIKVNIYDRCELQVSNYRLESESKEYAACRFDLNGLHIISRNSKITTKKTGQFVTFWQRNGKGTIAPFHQYDYFNFFIVNVQNDDRIGQFVFPKTVLIKNGIISSDKKEGKRGFRIYPIWDNPDNKQAKAAQLWQLNHFYEIKDILDFNKIKELYNTY